MKAPLVQDIDSLSKFRGHVECDFAYVPSWCQLALQSSAQALSIFMLLSHHMYMCTHTHTPPWRSRDCALSLWLSRAQQKHFTDWFEKGSIQNAMRSGCSSHSGNLWRMSCTRHGVLRHNSACVGQLCPQPRLFRVWALELSLPEPLLCLNLREK